MMRFINDPDFWYYTLISVLLAVIVFFGGLALYSAIAGKPLL
jgi:hypothetical protein